jgi:hypothetical protein
MPNIMVDNLREVIGEHAARQSYFMTDEAQAFTGIGWNFASHGISRTATTSTCAATFTRTRSSVLFDP